MAKSRRCLYCGCEAKLTREHIVPEAIGGTKWTKSVCEKCNPEVLSQLDKELACRSYLSLIAAQELCKATEYTWDVAHSDNNLLLEAQADTVAGTMTLWPQLVLDRGKWAFFTSTEDLAKYGVEGVNDVFVPHLRRAFKTANRIQPTRISSFIPPMCRYPPRVFARKRLNDFHNRMHFQCRYLWASDKKELLRRLGNWDSAQQWQPPQVCKGSHQPVLQVTGDTGKVLRCFFKIALNLLHFLCKHTDVNRDTFPSAVRLVTGEHAVTPKDLRQNGFVYAADVRRLECPDRCHKIRLWHDRGVWHACFAFFSGRIGAFITFQGPSRESWRTAKVTVPLRESKWDIRRSPILQPLTVRCEWKDLERIAPSLPIENQQARIRIE